MTPPSHSDLELIVQQIEELPTSSGVERNAVTLWERRLHLARGPDERIELFLEGELTTFGESAVGSDLEFGTYRESKEQREFPAIVIKAPTSTDVAARLMAHVAYEARQLIRAEPSIPNNLLLESLAPFLRMVVEREILTVEQQVGLTAELMLLKELLNRADELDLSPGLALSRWQGWDSASRDFKGGSVAIEAKATQGDQRLHWVRPMYQLLPAPGEDEQVYVFSVGLRVDRSRDFRLITMIDRVLEELPGASRKEFLEKVGRYGGVGFDSAQRRRYQLEPGMLVTKPPVLFRVDLLGDILRPSSFADGSPPARAHELRYRVSLEGLPATALGVKATLLEALVRGE